MDHRERTALIAAWTRRRVGACAIALAPLFCACGDRAPAAAPDSSVPLALDDAAALATPDAAPPRCTEGSTIPCACASANRVGRRSCVDGVYADTCEDCKPGSLCTPGRYEGRYAIPEYMPVAAGFCGLFTVFGGPGSGAIAFTLAPASDDEFAEIVSTDSCLELTIENDAGTPDADAGVAGVSTLRMELSGKVDCATGLLEGEVRGVYYSVSLCNGGTVQDYYSMKGRVTAAYDPDTERFGAGVLDIHEPAQLLDVLGFTKPPGGRGSFEAAWAPDAGAPLDAGDCLGGQPYEDFPLP
jgi:hypothetical protein